MSPGLEYLLSVLAERGLSVRFGSDGAPSLRGDKAEVTPVLREMLALYRDEIVATLPREPQDPAGDLPRPPAGPTTEGVAARPREWRFACGIVLGVSAEAAALHEQEDAGTHPANAIAWRFLGEQDWQEIGR